MPAVPSPFVHLHVHSTYSLRDGACQVEDLVTRAVEFGMPALAITDHGNLFAQKLFHDCATKAKIKPILGCEAYVAPDHLKRERGYNHLILLAKNPVGYHNLVRLISLAHLEGMYYRPRIDKPLLEKYGEGLIISSACIQGEVAANLRDGHPELAEKAALWYRERWGDDFYLEIMLHKATYSGFTDKNAELYRDQLKVNEGMRELGRRLGIKLVATNDVHFLREEDAEAHDYLLCLGDNKELNDPDRLRYTRQEWFKSYDEMRQVFPNDDEALRNTLEVAEKVESYKLNADPIMPVFPIPAEFGSGERYAALSEDDLRAEFGKRYEKLAGSGPDGADKVRRIKFEYDYLRHLTLEGAAKRWPGGLTDEQRERLDFELETIKTMGFPGYFLIVSDFIRAAREMGVWVGPGRGSAAGSAVAYCLGITNIDPIPYGLLFERFLNPDRISMPDIDVDFDDIGRERVLRWVAEKYGHDHVSHIATFGTMAPKSAIKDVARILRLPIPASNFLSSLVPDKASSFKKALNPKECPEGKGLQDMVADPGEIEAQYNAKVSDQGQRVTPESVATVLRIARKLDGSVRQPGVHACGILISRDPLLDTLPVMPSGKASPDAEEDPLMCTQYDGHFIEPLGLLKMDFLGLKTLTVLKECLAIIRESRGIDIDIDAIPLDDAKTYELFGRGETTGLFQFESEGMKKNLRELHPDRIDDLVAMNALYRPGPMAYIPRYIARKQGREPVTYDHPLMEEILQSTYGVTVYQEQVMLLSRRLAGFTRGESDTLRKAMGKKKIEEMEKLYVKFREGCLANPAFMEPYPVSGSREAAESVIGQVWGDWRAFAEYAFNKSHAVCYAVLAYKTGYLKANYPVEYMCAQISSEIGNFDKLPVFVAEAAEMGIEIRSPDVNTGSSVFFPAGERAMSYGLGGVKGVGRAAAESIIAERKKNGPYKGFFDFCSRIDTTAVNRRTLETLVKCGALDCLGLPRARMFAGIDTALARGAADRRDREQGQATFFDLFGGASTSSANASASSGDNELPNVHAWLPREKFGYEKELLGLYLTGHPLSRYRHLEGQFATLSDVDTAFRRLRTPDDTADLRVLAWVSDVSERRDKKGNPWAILKLEDMEDNHAEGLFFADYYKDYSTIVHSDCAMVLCGQVSISYRDGQSMTFAIREAYPMEEVSHRFADSVILTMEEESVSEETLERVRGVLDANPGTTSVRLRIHTHLGRTVLADLDATVTPDEPLFRALSAIPGLNAKAGLRPDTYLEKKSMRPRWPRTEKNK